MNTSLKWLAKWQFCHSSHSFHSAFFFISFFFAFTLFLLTANSLFLSSFQRQMMEAYIRQKRATPGMVQASDLQMARPMSGATTAHSATVSGAHQQKNGREIHGYDGPMQFMMSPNNPDQLLSTSVPTSPSNEGQCTLHTDNRV